MADGDVEFVKELLDLWLDALPGRLGAMVAAFEADNATLVGETAHRLNGSSRVLGIDRVGHAACAVEEAAFDGNLSLARRHLQRMLSEVELFKQLILCFDWTQLQI